MATITTNDDFVHAVNYLITQGQLPVTVARFIDATARKVYDETTPLTDITPNTATLETALDNANAEITQAETIATAQSGLLDKVALAEQYADSIKILYNAVLDQTENQTAQPNRFNTLYAVVQSAPVAFRNRFVTDCTHELGFDVTGVLTAAQQRQSSLYIRVWITGLALLLMARKVL